MAVPTIYLVFRRVGPLISSVIVSIKLARVSVKGVAAGYCLFHRCFIHKFVRVLALQLAKNTNLEFWLHDSCLNHLAYNAVLIVVNGPCPQMRIMGS